VVMEKRASVNTKRREVAEATSHDFWRKKNELALAKSTKEKTGHFKIRRRAGWLGEKPES